MSHRGCHTHTLPQRGRPRSAEKALRTALNLEDSRKCLLFLRTVVLGIKTRPSSWFTSLEVQSLSLFPRYWVPPLGSGVHPVWASTPEPLPVLFPQSLASDFSMPIHPSDFNS